MREFAKLYQRLDETTKTNDKVSAMRDYFSQASGSDAAYALYFLLGNKLKPSLPTRIIRRAARLGAGVPEWLFEETYQWVGDLAETAAAMAKGQSQGGQETLSETIAERLLPLLRSASGTQRSTRKSSASAES